MYSWQEGLALRLVQVQAVSGGISSRLAAVAGLPAGQELGAAPQPALQVRGRALQQC